MSTLEEQLVLACVNGATPSEAIAALLRRAPRWGVLTELSQRSKVSAAVYHRLAPFPRTGVIPAEALDGLRKVQLVQIGRFAELSGVLESVLRAFWAQGIETIVLKGAALAIAVYPLPSMRAVGDLDLLTREADLAAAARVLRKLGFTQEKSSAPEDHHHLPPFSRDGVCVELHRNIVEPRTARPIPAASLWERKRPLRVGAVDAYMFDPEHQILHAALHTALGHTFGRMLYQLVDIRETIHRFEPALDWNLLLDCTDSYDVRWPVFLSLRAAAEVTGAAVPADVLRRLRPKDRELSLRAAARMLPKALLGFDRAGRVPEWLYLELLQTLIEAGGDAAALRQAASVLLRRGRKSLT